MAELPPGVGETVLDVIDKEIETTLVNGVSEDIQQVRSATKPLNNYLEYY